MEFKTYAFLPPEAKALREAVFVKEQGFQGEFDDVDKTCTHGVLFDGDQPVACSRFFPGDAPQKYILGRICVDKSRRGTGLGSVVVEESEKAVAALGGQSVILHAQCRAQHFYHTLGYQEYGPVEDEEGVPHQWMRKKI